MNWKRELRKISYKYRHCIANDSWDLSNPLSISDEEKVKFCIKCISARDLRVGKTFEKIVKENNISYSNLIDYFGVDVLDAFDWNRLYKYSNKYRNGKVYIERRDNKSYYNYANGSPCGAAGNYVRYPSKKRSLRTWRNFYNLFPWLAKQDGWDGKKSSRYP